MGIKRREPYYATGQPVPPGDDGWEKDIENIPDPKPEPPKKPAAMKGVKLPHPTAIDFETFGIESRPDYPPEPVGVAIKPWGKKAKYYAWGHLRGANNCTKDEAGTALKTAYSNPDGVLFHHAKFDLDVAEVHFGLELPPWDKVHDTTFMLFLHDPHQRHVDLKDAATRILNQPPDERDAVADWLVTNQPVEGVKISQSPQGKEPYGKYIAWAPPSIVGPYAIGDVDRTVGLFEHLYPSLAKREMLPAYDRERRLTPILLGMERSGIRVDMPRLRADVARYGSIVTRFDAYIKCALGVDRDPDFNVDSGQQVVAALVAAGLADVTAMGITKTGKVKSDKNALAVGVSDKQLAAVMKYATQLKTCLNTFMKPWLAMAERSGGFIFTTWNQIRGADAGARTGRFSSTPNFQNIPKEFEPIFREDALAAAETAEDRQRASALPPCPWKDLPALPLCRSYIVPYEKGHVLVGRDYCFSADTEVLTRDGFVRFDRLTRDVDVAQWDHGIIDYVRPSAYQKVESFGSLTRIVGDRSCDLLVTPTHNCLLQNESGGLVAVPAAHYPTGHHKQFHAGVYPGILVVDEALARFVVALQADATVKGDDRLVWKLKKARKRERLRELFEILGLNYQEVPTADGQVTVTTRASLVPGLRRLIYLNTKTFTRDWLEVQHQVRTVFLAETAWWDGRRNGETGSAWSFFSTNQTNVELISELAAITGLRANVRWDELPSGKIFGTVNLRRNAATWVDTFRREEIPYGGMVYCVTVPSGAIVVRRNGKIMVTGQSQQEPRILAHFEDGELLAQYQADPWIDYHDNAKFHLELIFKRQFKRKPVKNINLGIIYGQGVGSLAAKNGETVEDTQELKNAILALYPGLKDMGKDMKIRARAGQPIRTWGGREYYCEPPRIIDGRIQTFDYKMINVLVQGSAADCTKEGMIRFMERQHNRGWRILLQVHDEIVLSVPAGDLVEAQEALREAMESVEFDVKILSEGAYSSENWSVMKDYDRKGKLVHGRLSPQKKRVVKERVSA